MSYAVMPMADYKSICDKVREKTDSAEVIKSGDMTDKVEEVYRAGQLSVFLSSEALKGKAEGNPINISDISKVEHGLSVKLSSDTITDFSSVTVTTCGKNLLDTEEIIRKYSLGEYEKSEDTNSYTVVDIQLKPNTEYVVKINGEQNGSTTFINNKKKVNTTSGISISPNWAITEKVLTTGDTGKLYFGTYGVRTEEALRKQFDLALIQIEEGEVATEYEEYKCVLYHSEFDGTVSAVKSIYPVMNISADADVTISADYFKDIDKTLGEGAS